MTAVEPLAYRTEHHHTYRVSGSELQRPRKSSVAQFSPNRLSLTVIVQEPCAPRAVNVELSGPRVLKDGSLSDVTLTRRMWAWPDGAGNGDDPIPEWVTQTVNICLSFGT
jgi:hypothetical protein